MRETSAIPPSSPRQPPKDYKEDPATKRAREKASKQLEEIDSATTPEALERARISLKVQGLRKPSHQEVGEEIHTGRKLAEMMITEIKAKEAPKTPQEQLIVRQIEELNAKIAAHYAPAGGTRIFKKD